MKNIKVGTKKKYWKNLTDKEKKEVYEEVCKSELYQDVLNEVGSGWCTEFSETFMMYKNAETENGELITVERFKEIILDKLRTYL
ncbi:hypothetical protein O3885_12040 [Fusobacterium sp. 27098_8_59]|jgi:hypothetical protein|uniref:hypothetical protein n=1 Tax=Fusobacterium sp. 27098_8_59 TaxID=3003691 RepID=UPI00352C020D